jgi:hypothetical protein
VLETDHDHRRSSQPGSKCDRIDEMSKNAESLIRWCFDADNFTWLEDERDQLVVRHPERKKD